MIGKLSRNEFLLLLATILVVSDIASQIWRHLTLEDRYLKCPVFEVAHVIIERGGDVRLFCVKPTE